MMGMNTGTITIIGYIVIILLDLYTYSRGDIYKKVGGTSLAIDSFFIGSMLMYPQNNVLFPLYTIVDSIKNIVFITQLYEPLGLESERVLSILTIAFNMLILVWETR